MTELCKHLQIRLLGFDTAFACYAANTCAKTIHFFTFRHGLKPVATNIFSLTGKPLSLLLYSQNFCVDTHYDKTRLT